MNAFIICLSCSHTCCVKDEIQIFLIVMDSQAVYTAISLFSPAPVVLFSCCISGVSLLSARICCQSISLFTCVNAPICQPALPQPVLYILELSQLAWVYPVLSVNLPAYLQLCLFFQLLSVLGVKYSIIKTVTSSVILPELDILTLTIS